MIKLSNLADYAVVLMSAIAARPDKLYTAAGLNNDTRVPLPTVSKILGKLARAKLLISHRGIGGGFSMNGTKENISIADIIEAVDGPVQLTNCLSVGEHNCDYELRCLTRSKWDKINNAVYEALNNVPLSEMAAMPYDFFPLSKEETLKESKG